MERDRRMPRKENSRTLGFECLGDRALPSTIFITSAIVPPNETTELVVKARSDENDELVRGLNLRAQLGDGRGPIREPVFESLSYDDTIWSPLQTQSVGGLVESEPQFAQSTIVMVNPDEDSLLPEGAIARLTINTQDVLNGTFEIRFQDTPFPDSDFASVPAEAEVGSVTIAQPGDSNLDGVFNSKDLIQILIAGEYEDDVPDNSDWIEGDWDNSGDFDSADFVYALANGKYVR
jgi:hypothetical protein